MNKNAIYVNHLSKSFGTGQNKQQVLKDLSFSIGEGEFVSVMGPSGCGKSTLLYLIGGLDKPDSGDVRICDRNIKKLSDKEKAAMRRRDVGFIFQFYNLVPNLTVEENILLSVIMDGQKPQQFKKQLDRLLDLTGLSRKRKAFPTELSGGQQQRVAIARALIMNPKILLADEPTGNLDKKSGEAIMQLFDEVNREMHVTILQVTHSEEMAAWGRRTMVMEDGVIVRDEAAGESEAAKDEAEELEELLNELPDEPAEDTELTDEPDEETEAFSEEEL